MSSLALKMPTKPTSGYFLPVSDVWSTSGQQTYLEFEPSSTAKVSDVFRSLADEWRRDTGHMSLISQRVNHPAYKRIIRMGNAAVPLILEDLQRTPGHWFHALITLADENPVPSDFDGTVEDAAALWVAWGQDNNLIDP